VSVLNKEVVAPDLDVARDDLRMVESALEHHVLSGACEVVVDDLERSPARSTRDRLRVRSDPSWMSGCMSRSSHAHPVEVEPARRAAVSGGRGTARSNHHVLAGRASGSVALPSRGSVVRHTRRDT